MTGIIRTIYDHARVTVCMWLLWLILKIFGQETFAISTVSALPEPALFVMHEYLQEIPA